MALRSGNRDHAIDRAAPADFYHIAQRVGIGRFADHAIIDNLALILKPAQHFARAVNARAFFIAGNQQRNRAFWCALRVQMGGNRGDKSGNRALHIGRAAPPKALLANFTGKRVDLPIGFRAHRHHIGVTGKANMRAFMAKARIKIIDPLRAVFFKRQARAGKAQIRQRALKHIQRPCVGRCDRRAANKIGGKLDGVERHQLS